MQFSAESEPIVSREGLFQIASQYSAATSEPSRGHPPPSFIRSEFPEYVQELVATHQAAEHLDAQGASLVSAQTIAEILACATRYVMRRKPPYLCP
jgi:hypothetical protein